LEFTDSSDSVAKFDLQGPLSAEVLGKLGVKASEFPKYYNWTRVYIDGVKCLLSRTGYTGELGFELYFSVKHAVQMWKLLLSIKPVKPVGLGARDTLRLEMGYPLYGHELNERTTPVEGGFGAMLKLEDGRKFVGSEALRKSRPTKFLVGVELDGRRAAREGSIVLIDSKPVGKVSSGAFGPSVGKAVAMAYVDAGYESRAAVGSKLEIDTGRGVISGVVVELPFYKNGTVRAKL
jgi:aminomethyltransferase